MPIRSFLVPPEDHPALADALARVRQALAETKAAFLFLSDWRTKLPTWAARGLSAHPVPEDLLRSWREELDKNAIFYSPPADVALPYPGFPFLPDGLPVLPVSFPLVSPEGLVDLGLTMQAAAEAWPWPVAAVAVGYLAGAKAPADQRQRFTDAVVDLFRAGLGHQLPNLDMELWLAGRPHQDLGHLFLLLGTAGGTTPAALLGSADSPRGSAAVLDLDPRRDDPPAYAPPAFIPLRPTT